MFPSRLELSCTDPCLCHISAVPAPVLPQGTQSGAAGCAPQLLSRHRTFQESNVTLCTDVPRSVYEMGSDLCFKKNCPDVGEETQGSFCEGAPMKSQWCKSHPLRVWAQDRESQSALGAGSQLSAGFAPSFVLFQCGTGVTEECRVIQEQS